MSSQRAVRNCCCWVAIKFFARFNGTHGINQIPDRQSW